MPWVCDHDKCNRVTKGFRRGRTLCHICQRCHDRASERRQERICIEPGCNKIISSSVSKAILRCATCVRLEKQKIAILLSET